MKSLSQVRWGQWFRVGLLLIGAVPILSMLLPVQAQTASPGEVARLVYQQLPDLPLENQYQRSENGKQAVDSTLVSRLVVYHTQVKGRSPLQRLTWKVTLADYLGVNDYLEAKTYPGHAFLKTNPMERDQTLIQKLNQSQRNTLIQALVDAFTGPVATTQTSSPTPPPPPKPSKATSPAAKPVLPPLIPSGSADDLLKPASPSSPPPSTGEAQFLRP